MTRMTPSTSLLLVGAAAATSAALASDIRLGEHPTHTIVLVQVAVVMVWLTHRLRHGLSSAVAIVASALTAQPLLHMSASAGPPSAVAHNPDDALHVLISELPSATLQIVAPALVLVALTAAAHLVGLLVTAVRPPAPCPRRALATRARLPVMIRSLRRGARLQWCGWAILAARRGPPVGPTHAAL